MKFEILIGSRKDGVHFFRFMNGRKSGGESRNNCKDGLLTLPNWCIEGSFIVGICLRFAKWTNDIFESANPTSRFTDSNL
jgi:hypothetical protein